MAKAAKKVTEKVKPQKRELIIRDRDDVMYNLTRFIEGENCKEIICNAESSLPWFKIRFKGHTETFIGIPYSVIEPIK